MSAATDGKRTPATHVQAKRTGATTGKIGTVHTRTQYTNTREVAMEQMAKWQAPAFRQDLHAAVGCGPVRALWPLAHQPCTD